MQALTIHAGPRARRHIEANGLRPRHIGVVPGAAGGPKGLILGPLDRFIFGEWLTQSQQPVHLVGASIGAWRLGAACLNRPVDAFRQLEADYIAQDFDLEPGRTTPTAAHVSARFSQNLKAFYGERAAEVLGHPRFRLHIVTSRGRHVLRREHMLGTPLGYVGAFMANAIHRRAMGAWLERVVFSSPQAGADELSPLPFETGDYATRQVALSQANFHLAMQASCSIPFALKAIQDIPGAPRGAYWDGGITDYHLHLNYKAMQPETVVLYPHFQKSVVPGWLDKGLKWRHGATAYLDNMVLLAPSPEWVSRLPGGKLPDRTDFVRYGKDLKARSKAWGSAVAASCQLADEFAAWLDHPDLQYVSPL